MRNSRLAIACLLTLLLTLGACQSQVAYHHYRHVSSPGWDKSDTLHFDVQPMTEDGAYELVTELRIVRPGSLPTSRCRYPPRTVRYRYR